MGAATRRRRIVFVLSNGLAPGGAERVASILLEQWVCRGFDVTMVSMTSPITDFYSCPDSVSRVEIGGKADSPNAFRGLVSNIQRVAKLRTTLKALQPDVVVSFITMTNIRTLLASLSCSWATIVSERVDITAEDVSRPWRFLRRVTYPLATYVTSNSYRTLDVIRQFVPQSRLRFVANPVNYPPYGAIPQRSQTILSIGRLAAQKNQHFMINVCSKILRENRGWRLEIVGEGPERKSLTELISRVEIDGQIRINGRTRDVAGWYSRAAVFVLTSRYEGTPNVVLEAMSYGLPVIVPDTIASDGHLPIDNGRTGLLYRAGDEGHFRSRLSMLVCNPHERMRIGENARKEMQQFEPSVVMKQWNELLGEPVSRSEKKKLG